MVFFDLPTKSRSEKNGTSMYIASNIAITYDVERAHMESVHVFVCIGCNECDLCEICVTKTEFSHRK